MICIELLPMLLLLSHIIKVTMTKYYILRITFLRIDNNIIKVTYYYYDYFSELTKISKLVIQVQPAHKH